jgi:tetratricopeptide (TPR) repeat protein
MKKYIAMALLSAGVLTSCGEYNKVLKSTDSEYKYEAAKEYFAKGQNTKAATLLEELVNILKGMMNGEEALYMQAMTYFNQGDYVTASHYFNTYYTTYPRGTYTKHGSMLVCRGKPVCRNYSTQSGSLQCRINSLKDGFLAMIRIGSNTSGVQRLDLFFQITDQRFGHACHAAEPDPVQGTGNFLRFADQGQRMPDVGQAVVPDVVFCVDH